MKFYSLLIAGALLLGFLLPENLLAQKAKPEQVTFKYYRNALVKTDEANRTYSFDLNIPFADSYNADRTAYLEDEGRAQAEYEADRAAAEEEYAAALAAYNNQGAGAKILQKALLGDDGKPIKRTVTKRYVRPVPVRNDIPQESEIWSGLMRDGFSKQDGGHFTIQLTIPNYTVITKDEPSGSESMKRTATITLPIDMKVTDASGNVVYTAVSTLPPASQVFKTNAMKAKDFSNFISGSAYDSWLDQQKLTYRQRCYEFLAQGLNEQMGYGWTERTSPVYTGKGKKLDYSSLDGAQLKAVQGLKDLSISEATSKQKLAEAQDVWADELKQQDLTDKKARINNKVAAGLYINLALVNILLGDYAKADEYLNTVQGNDDFKGGDQREAERLREFLDDERRRNG